MAIDKDHRLRTEAVELVTQFERCDNSIRDLRKTGDVDAIIEAIKPAPALRSDRCEGLSSVSNRLRFPSFGVAGDKAEERAGQRRL